MAAAAWRKITSSLGRSGLIGVTFVMLLLLFAFLAPFFAPYPPDLTIGSPYMRPSLDAVLGTDGVGRDVLSRLCWGGRSVILLAGAATIVAYLGGLTIGLIAGYVRSVLDPLLMRTVDIALAFPALLFILLAVAAVGFSRPMVVLAVGIVQMPQVARIIRSATLAQSVRGYVEVAVARGEPTFTVLRREILPNIRGTIAADIGLRFTFSIIIIASLNFLGLGLPPPTADWGLMVAENRGGIALNPWATIAPALVIALVTISVNLVGSASATRILR